MEISLVIKHKSMQASQHTMRGAITKMKSFNLSRIAMLLILTSVFGCMPSQSIIVVQQLSGSEYTATLSKRNSGAAGPGSTLVSVRLTGVPDNETHGVIVLGISGDKPIQLKWIDAHHLSLACESCKAEDVNFEATKTGDVIVGFDPHLSVQ